MIFIRPTILRDAAQTALETDAKYNMIRDIQKSQQGRGIQLMPGQQRLMLPPIEEYRTPRDDEEEEQDTDGS